MASIGGKELEELRESEARSRIVVETVADAIITIDEASTMLFVNPAAERIFGYAADEMRGEHLTMLMPEYLRHLHDAGMQRYVETGHKHISWEGVELPGLHKSGKEIPLEVSFGEFALKGRRYFTGIARDITERKRTERRLAAQYAVTRVLAEAPSLDEAAPAIMQAVCEGLRWEMGALWSVDDEGNALCCVESWQAPSAGVAEFEALSSRRTFARGEGLLGRVWESGAAIWVEDLTSSNFPRAGDAAASDLHGACAFPILLRSEVLGVMEFFSRQIRQPDEALLAMMSHLGSQIGQAIERKRAEDERARLQEQVIRMQDAQLVELSTPLIPVTQKIVVMPLVGSIDSKRAQRMIETLLRGLEERRAAVAIIDITGVPVVDTHVANTLIQAARAARLLGTEVVLTGIRAAVAQTLVGLGVELEGITTRKNLQGGVAYAFEHLRRQDSPANL
jgi:PAS domain S-box-containing protein